MIRAKTVPDSENPQRWYVSTEGAGQNRLAVLPKMSSVNGSTDSLHSGYCSTILASIVYPARAFFMRLKGTKKKATLAFARVATGLDFFKS